ncbi:leucine rich adaptor protein 1-like [Dunckerocampus dactyliophorus]|uniref:leucine rich adaptor protein 1-like n=1 Tax=Dunckerocampus dactyliophorus TaxID=161453 RepID=UPI002404A714|nr:leucine rich adaptor protein 1-like [Dunckerocampus dactyliophorus]
MDEGTASNVTPDLRELESKVGRKTPESLLLWMRDDVDADVSTTEDLQYSPLSDAFADKLSNLKQEMRWMRSADVRILRQLVSVHEGIEAMRWLLSERSALASRDSSLTGSLSNLMMAEEHGPSVSPCRDVPRSTYAENVHGSFNGGSSDGDANHSHGRSTVERQSNFSDSQPRHSGTHPSLGTKACAEPVGGVLLGSTTTPRDVKADEKSREEDEKMANEVLFGYDARWCWIQSQDDVTFL